MKHYHIEVTDLFCGEMNYSFIKRFNTTAKSERGAMQKLSRHTGLNWRKYCDDGDGAIYHTTSKLSGAYVQEYELNVREEGIHNVYAEVI
jgi:hypothetical protein